MYGHLWTPDEVTGDEARKILSGRKAYFAIIMTSMWVVVGTIQYLVYPKLQSLYESFGTKSQVSGREGYIMAGLAVVTVLTLIPVFSGRWDETLEKRIQEAGGAGKIKTFEIPGRSYEPIALLILGIAVGLLVYSVISPIYSLTSGL